MPQIRIIPNGRDGSRRSLIRTLKDALCTLIDAGEFSPNSTLEIAARSEPGRLPSTAALLFKSCKGDDALFPLPISKGFWATETHGGRLYMTLDRLNKGEVDSEGNVRLNDGTWIHTVSFDLDPVHFELPELESKVIYLTVRYLQAEAECIRTYYDTVFGIDYAALPRVRVPNVKALTRFVNATINDIPRASGAPPFGEVPIATVHRALDLANIQKVRGRPTRAA